MFFIDKDPVRVTVRSEDAQYGTRGQKVKTLKRRVFAQFQRGIPDWAVPAAEALDFSHMPPERTIQQWCGFYDSEADQLQHSWTDEERETIEATLLRNGYEQVEKAKASLPYPAYGKQRKVHGKRLVSHVIEDILATLDTTGLDPGLVLAYEIDHADKDSQAIIDAFTTPVAEEVAAEEVEEMVSA